MSLTVWACASPANGNSATSAMAIFFISNLGFLIVLRPPGEAALF
jgi:hypothetical protein